MIPYIYQIRLNDSFFSETLLWYKKNGMTATFSYSLDKSYSEGSSTVTLLYVLVTSDCPFISVIAFEIDSILFFSVVAVCHHTSNMSFHHVLPFVLLTRGLGY